MHIIRNAIEKCRGRVIGLPEGLAWALQKADTRALYDSALHRLRQVCPVAAQYFDNIANHEQVYQYAFNEHKIATHEHKSSNVVEGPNGVFKEVREHAPYRGNNKILKWIGKEFAARVETMTKWIQQGHYLTPYAHALWSEQVQAQGLHCALLVSLCHTGGVGKTQRQRCHWRRSGRFLCRESQETGRTAVRTRAK